jgi:hypothetical protein
MKVSRYVCGKCGTGYAAWTDRKTGQLRVMARRES